MTQVPQTAVTVSSTPSTLETVFQDIFEVGIGAASIFVTNPNSQAKAVSIINILKAVFPQL